MHLDPKQPKSHKSIFDNECRILNAGSIVFLPGATGTGVESTRSTGRASRHNSTASGGGVAAASSDRHSIKLSEMSLEDFTDRIKDDETVKTPSIKEPKSEVVGAVAKIKRPIIDEGIQEEDEDEEDEEDEEELEEDEEDEEEEEECDNCITRTKYGNYVYKYGYRPLVRPLKFIYYTIVENVKLLKLLRFTIFAMCNFILSFFYESPFYFINSYMIENGSSSSQAGTVTVAVGIVSVFSSSN